MSNDKGSLVLEYDENWTILHIDSFGMLSKETYNYIVEHVPNLADFVRVSSGIPLIAAISMEHKGVQRLAKKVGFNYVGDVMGISLYVYGEEKWDQPQVS